MRKSVFAALLVAYSLLLMGIELLTSQEFVRNFFADVTGPVPFYAVNTSLSVFLLWSTALVFGLCLYVNARDNAITKNRFYLSQVLVFGYLGCDDLFLFHERVKPMFGFPGEILLLVVGLAEMHLLIVAGGFFKMPSTLKAKIYVAACLFGLMLSLDLFAVQEAVLRLSIEDLCKTWAGFFFLMFAIDNLTGEIESIRAKACVR